MSKKMKEYIEREAAVSIAHGYCHTTDGRCCGPDDVVELYEELKAIPAADVVEVVRCRDCHWAHPILGEADITCDIDCLSHYNDDYCSYGQRKDGGVNDGKAD